MKRLLGALLLMVLLLATATPVLAQVYNDAPMVPPRPVGAPAPPAGDPIYDRYSFRAYQLRGTNMSMENNLTYTVINATMVAKAWLVKMAIRVSEYALQQNLYDSFADQAGKAMQSLTTALWENDGAVLALAGLGLGALWAVLLYMRGRAPQAWGTIGGTALVLIALAAITAEGPTTVKATVELSRQMSVQLYAGISEAATPANANPLLVRAQDQAWRSLVYQPWGTAFFGSDAVFDQVEFKHLLDRNQPSGSAFLAMDGEATRVTTLCGPGQYNMMCPAWDDNAGLPILNLPWRLVLAAGTFVLGAAYAAVVFGLAGGILVAQLALLFLLALAPVWLLIALWMPGRSIRVLGRIFSWALTALVGQAVLTATFSVMLVLVAQVGSLSSLGWAFQALLITALGILGYKYRYAWLVPVRTWVERPDRETGRLADQLRGLLGRRPAGAPVAVAGTGAGVTVTELVPLFSAVQQPPAHVEHEVQHQMPEMQQQVRGEREPYAPPDAPGRQLFITEMVHLRERLAVQSVAQLRESATEAARRDWEEPAPVAASGASSGAAKAAAKRVGDFRQIPPQRPKG